MTPPHWGEKLVGPSKEVAPKLGPATCHRPWPNNLEAEPSSYPKVDSRVLHVTQSFVCVLGVGAAFAQCWAVGRHGLKLQTWASKAESSVRLYKPPLQAPGQTKGRRELHRGA